MAKTNKLGLEKSDYKGKPSTLCKGCGHDSISSRIINVAFEMGLEPHETIKLSGIGCSSKSPAYFLGRSHSFNAVHGRMPSVATGAYVSNHTLTSIGVSGDGDTASIGLGQFKHLLRRNVPMIYIVENNGVYGLTKGQFSATSDIEQELKYAGVNKYLPIDICLLGMGADMHTASLIPGAEGLEAALDPHAPILVPIRAKGEEEARVTLSARVLAGAVCTHLMITGARKRTALERARHLRPLEAPVAAVLGNATVHWAPED